MRGLPKFVRKTWNSKEANAKKKWKLFFENSRAVIVIFQLKIQRGGSGSINLIDCFIRENLIRPVKKFVQVCYFTHNLQKQKIHQHSAINSIFQTVYI